MEEEEKEYVSGDSEGVGEEGENRRRSVLVEEERSREER